MIRSNNLPDQPIPKGDKKTIRGWVTFDWANSVYQLTISSTIFPIYYNVVTHQNDDYLVTFFGREIINTVLFSWTIAAAYLIVAALSPLLSSMADYTGRRRAYMDTFTWIGALGCGMLFFFTDSTIELGIIAFALGTLGYGGSLVYYNSFLPVIAEPKDYDRISARGYSWGYLGGVVLLFFNLLMIMQPQLFFLSGESDLPARISFLTVSAWWIGFSRITFRRLPKYTFRKRMGRANVLTNGYKELRAVFSQVRKMPHLRIYLVSFFFMMMGLLTVMFMAATYGSKELGIKEDTLIITIIIVQFVGILGAWFFARVSAMIGNIRTLAINIVLWALVCYVAFFIKDVAGFVAVACCIGLLMGGSQALARSTYSKMLPETTTDHTSFFSFYDVLEKLATVAGTFSFGIIEAITHDMRYSVLAITSFFILSLFFMMFLWRQKI